MKYELWLANIKGIGNQKIQRLLAACSNAEELYFSDEKKLGQIYGITDEDIWNITECRKHWNLEKEVEALGEQGISFVSMEQESYPKRLRNIQTAPYALYYRGHLPKEEKKAVAIVGARGRSEYGSTVARELARELVRTGAVVISGLARGIDADGHAGALEQNGMTFGILGCGVDVCYPQQNRYLYEKIQKKGGIISEYPPGTPAKAAFFPARNRIISGMSDCVVVVEARKKSGSLITADYAMEQGKEVYAVPGRIKDALSQGCNELIRQGAAVFTSVEDFLEDWQLHGNVGYRQLDFKLELLQKEEHFVYEYLDYNPVGIGGLTDRTGLSVPVLSDILDQLCDKGFAREVVPNYYVKIS